VLCPAQAPPRLVARATAAAVAAPDDCNGERAAKRPRAVLHAAAGVLPVSRPSCTHAYLRALQAADRGLQAAALAVLQPPRRWTEPGAATFGVSSLFGDAPPPPPPPPCPERAVALLLERAEELFPPVVGVGLGALSAALRHSCLPNAVVELAGGATLQCVALRAIANGEELLCAFVPPSLPRRERDAQLQARGRPPCACGRCALDGARGAQEALRALPRAEALALARALACEEGRPARAAELLRGWLAGAAEAEAASDGEARHFLGQALLMDGQWAAAHREWAAAAAQPAAARAWPALRLQAEKDASFWPADGAGPAAAQPPAFCSLPLGVVRQAALSCGPPLFSASRAAELIARAEAAAAAAGGWTTRRHYSAPTTDLPIAGEALRPFVLPFFNQLLREALAPMAAAAFPQLLPGGAGTLRVHDCFLVRYCAEAQRALPPHADESVLSFTVALNDGFEGGGTHFEAADLLVRPAAGQAVAFEGEVRHAGEATTAGVRYVLAVFCWVAA